jgi:hypothetical protein
MNNASTRAMLRMLSLYHKHNGKIDEATKEYYAWAIDRNQKIKNNKWKYELVRIPEVMRKFASEIEKHEKEAAMSPRRLKRSIEYSLARTAAGRFMRKAHKIMENVCVGKYPGIF